MYVVPRRRLLCGAFGLGVASSGLPFGLVLGATQVRLQLITAKANPIRDISLPELRQLYRGRRIPLSGLKAVPFNHPPGTPDRVGFDGLVLGMGPQEVARYWVDQKVRGGDAPPRTVDSVALLLRVIVALPGAIGYVREGFMSPDLKVVSIEGRMPGDAGYPLIF